MTIDTIELIKEVATAEEIRRMYNFSYIKGVYIFLHKNGEYELCNCWGNGWYTYLKSTNLREIVDRYMKLINDHVQSGAYKETYRTPDKGDVSRIISIF